MAPAALRTSRPKPSPRTRSSPRSRSTSPSRRPLLPGVVNSTDVLSAVDELTQRALAGDDIGELCSPRRRPRSSKPSPISDDHDFEDRVGAAARPPASDDGRGAMTPSNQAARIGHRRRSAGGRASHGAPAHHDRARVPCSRAHHPGRLRRLADDLRPSGCRSPTRADSAPRNGSVWTTTSGSSPTRRSSTPCWQHALYTVLFTPIAVVSALVLAVRAEQSRAALPRLLPHRAVPPVHRLARRRGVRMVVSPRPPDRPAQLLAAGRRHPARQRAARTRCSAMPTVALVAVWKNFGFYMVIFLAGLQDVPASLYEAARIDGAGVWRRFRQRHPAAAVQHPGVRGGLRADRGTAGVRPDLRDDRRRTLRSHPDHRHGDLRVGLPQARPRIRLGTVVRAADRHPVAEPRAVRVLRPAREGLRHERHPAPRAGAATPDSVRRPRLRSCWRPGLRAAPGDDHRLHGVQADRRGQRLPADTAAIRVDARQLHPHLERTAVRPARGQQLRLRRRRDTVRPGLRLARRLRARAHRLPRATGCCWSRSSRA